MANRQHPLGAAVRAGWTRSKISVETGSVQHRQRSSRFVSSGALASLHQFSANPHNPPSFGTSRQRRQAFVVEEIKRLLRSQGRQTLGTLRRSPISRETGYQTSFTALPGGARGPIDRRAIATP
jgi:hypothetical protein